MRVLQELSEVWYDYCIEGKEMGVMKPDTGEVRPVNKTNEFKNLGFIPSIL